MVGALDGLGFSFKGANGSDGSKRFLLHAQGALWRIGKDRWLKKVSGARQPVSAAQQTCSTAKGIFDVFDGLISASLSISAPTCERGSKPSPTFNARAFSTRSFKN